MPVVEYGAGKVNTPRCGMNVWISPDESFGRRPAPVDESMNPPDCAHAVFCETTMTHADAHRSERIRRVPTSMLPPCSSGPAAEGKLPLSSRWHRSGNLLEPVEPGELVVCRPPKSQGLADPA